MLTIFSNYRNNGKSTIVNVPSEFWNCNLKHFEIYYCKGKTYIGIAFLLAHLQGLPQIGFFSLRRIPVPNLQPPTSTCYAVFEPVWLEKAYAIYTWFMQFLIPICVIIVCYVNISISSMRGIRNETPNDLNRQNSIFEDSARRKSRAAAGNSFLHSARRNKSTPNVINRKGLLIKTILRMYGLFLWLFYRSSLAMRTK